MDDGLTTTMAMMGYRVVDRIGSDRSSMDRWRCARGICAWYMREKYMYIYICPRASRRVCRVCTRVTLIHRRRRSIAGGCAIIIIIIRARVVNRDDGAM